MNECIRIFAVIDGKSACQKLVCSRIIDLVRRCLATVADDIAEGGGRNPDRALEQGRKASVCGDLRHTADERRPVRHFVFRNARNVINSALHRSCVPIAVIIRRIELDSVSVFKKVAKERRGSVCLFKPGFRTCAPILRIASVFIINSRYKRCKTGISSRIERDVVIKIGKARQPVKERSVKIHYLFIEIDVKAVNNENNDVLSRRHLVYAGLRQILFYVLIRLFRL